MIPAIPAFCQTPLARQAEQRVEQSIQIRQKTQKDRTQWEQEKSKLVLQYEQLLQQKQVLQKENSDLTARQTARVKLNQTLFIEAEYGSTIEVYQDKISMGSEDILGNIFRLGRVSLFFLSLDQTACAVFNPGLKKWQALPQDHLPAIRSAVEIAGKRRPVELLPLPLGRLATKGGNLE